MKTLYMNNLISRVISPLIIGINLIFISFPALAYLDPGTIGLVFSFIIGIISFIVLKLKSIFNTTKKFIKKLFIKEKKIL